MIETYQSNYDVLNDYRDEIKELEKDVCPRSMDSKKWIETKYPPTYYFWWVKLSKTESYHNIPWNPIRLKRTAKRCGTNPTYRDSLVITPSGKEQKITHNETYYTDKDTFANGKQKFPIENIEWRIRSILNKDREKQNLPKIPKNQKVRTRGEDWTIRDINWYIIVAADTKKIPRWSLIMTTLWPGRVYDVWSKVNGNHIDVFTSWPV